MSRRRILTKDPVVTKKDDVPFFVPHNSVIDLVSARERQIKSIRPFLRTVRVTLSSAAGGKLNINMRKMAVSSACRARRVIEHAWTKRRARITYTGVINLPSCATVKFVPLLS